MSDSRTFPRRLRTSASVHSLRVRLGLAVVLACCLLPTAVSAAYERELGHNEATTIVPSRDTCSGILAVNHDSSFESAYAWESYGAWPEYYGAWGEAYDFGPCQVVCGAYWLTTTPTHYEGEPANLYIWEGGVTGEPGAVLFVLPDVVFQNIPFWPQIGQNDVSIGVVVSGEFTIGFWGNWGPPFSSADFYIAVDEDVDGHPWTYIAPDIGPPSGWQHPSVVGPMHDCRSLGIGVYYGDPPTPVDATSWSHVKRLYY
jgi:hypothetical protein